MDDTQKTAIKQRFAEALTCYKQGKINYAQIICEEILQLDPEEGHTLQLLGLIMITNQSLREAILYLEKSIKQLPDSAACHLNLASAYSLYGNKQSAIEHYQRSLEIDPDNVEAYFNLVYLIDAEKNPHVIKPIFEILQKDNISTRDKILLHYTAGKYYDNNKLYKEAFEQIVTANLLTEFSYSPEFENKLISDTIGCFTPELFKLFKDKGIKTHAPLFIIGMTASGTSLLDSLLREHHNVGSIGSNTDFLVLAHELDKIAAPNLDYPECVKYLTPKSIEACATLYLQHLKKHTIYTYIINSFSLNFKYLGLIKLLFPDAKFLHVTRNPVDACLASYFTLFQRHYSFTNRLEHLADYYAKYHKLMQYWLTLFPKDILSLEFESLIMDPRQNLEKVLTFLDLPWDEHCLKETAFNSTYYFTSGFSINYLEFIQGLVEELKKFP